ncbi:hypothetical protein APHAL10511_008308 [Amanita phalloides]|nr:hypothetical protein APHAL10511_008308 [Amanita phalloides]
MRISKQQKSFPVSFTTFSELTNDERTRTFLVLEVGAGYHELKCLTTALSSILRLLRQQQYYENPRFHASIAWALLDRGALNPSASAGAEDTISDTGSSEQSETGANGNAISLSTRHHLINIASNFPTIPRFPEDLISTLNERYGSTLASTKVGFFDAEFMTVKIGKETFTWSLSG